MLEESYRRQIADRDAKIALLKEENAVLRSQVENADINLEQVRLNVRARFEDEIAKLKERNAELIRNLADAGQIIEENDLQRLEKAAGGVA